LLAAPVLALDAQVTPDPARPLTPPGWGWTTDAPAEPQRGGTGNVGTTRFEFTLMAPGWHVTMGPGAVLFPRELRAEDRFALDADLLFFPDGAPDAEAGLVVGGTDLEGARAAWTAFVVRPDGRVAVLRHEQGVTKTLHPWTAVAGVGGRDSTGFSERRLSVSADPDSIRFFVNGQAAGAWPRASVAVDGQYGLRVGRGANLHVTSLDITQRLAPYRPRR
jgi:hypothetical protein